MHVQSCVVGDLVPSYIMYDHLTKSSCFVFTIMLCGYYMGGVEDMRLP